MENSTVTGLLDTLRLVSKQLFGIDDQLGLVRHRLEEVSTLEKDSPQVNDKNPWSKMPAVKIGRSLKTARSLLEEARDILSAEYDCYEAWKNEIEEIKASDDDDETKIEALSAILEPAQSREPETAGLAAYCMETVRAVQPYIVAAMEKSRAYRSKAK